jgi:acyl-[acyl-carrier-protein]-phospholipid O-acyltransferase/long-chain-fatty-acid--[acyl-carrier-protein] ligase
MAIKHFRMGGFGWLNVTQFLGALNDNVFKSLVLFFLVDHLCKSRTTTIPLISAIFVVPFLLFSQAAGVLADRLGKRGILVASKVAEVVIMVIGVGGLLLESPVILLSVIFLMSTQSAFFGPAKYGVLPELVSRDRLSRANGSLVCMTYLAIIIGTFLPSFLLESVFPGQYIMVAGFCVLVAVAGVGSAIPIPRTAPAGGTQRIAPLFVLEIFRTLLRLRRQRYLFLAVVGAAYFLFLGGFVQQNILFYGQDVLGWNAQRSGFLFPMAALGIGLGAMMAGRLSGRNIEFGVVPIGALLLTICTLALGIIQPGIMRVLVLMLLTGMGAGLFTVPLDAYIQDSSPPAQRGEILACSNFLSFLGVALSAGLLFLLDHTLGLSPQACFVVIGVLTAGLAILTLVLLPDFVVRLVVVLITRFAYRVRASGLEHLPIEGGALLVANHVTWVDALLISSVTQRRIRFLMDRSIYNTRWINPIFRLMGVIPIASSDPPRAVVSSLQQARAAMDAGFMVCIFAEGKLTRNGNMHAFRGGFERMVRDSHLPVIPVHIGNAWGSIFSHYYGRLMSALPRRVPYPVTLQFGVPLPATVASWELRQAVQELGSNVLGMMKRDADTLGRRFVACARKRWWHHAMRDTSGKSLRFGRLLAGAVALGDQLRPVLREADHVGLLLPSSVGGALANLAVTLQGKVSVNLNFTASADSINSAMAQCGIRTVISSRAFVEKLGAAFSVPAGTIYLEDVAAAIPAWRKVLAMLKAACWPVRWLTGRAVADDLATVIFSSGSTGEPKGVMLSHFNVLANIEQVRQVFRYTSQERFAAVLPFFHSFGLTVTLWAPVTCGFSVCYHPNPLEGTVIGKMVREHKLSIMVATPTFLLSWMRRAGEGDFASLRALVTGAEKLSPRIADAFQARYGVRPVEGYGATELAPVISLNIGDVDCDGVRQVGTREGSVGHPVPGVSLRVEDLQTGALLPPGSVGLLKVKGPNLMLGYLGQPQKTAEVVQDGWYVTGDIASVDEDGFIFLQDRLSRFSKIAGEMVPHLAVEDALHGLLDVQERCVAVVAVEDERKGEQLIVCYTPAAGDPRVLHERLGTGALPNLWRPKKDNYMPIDVMPTLGSGKLDLARLKRMAAEFVENRPGRVQQFVNRLREAF